MNKELLWLALPICALLSQLGGTFKKQWRRLGIPSILTICYIMATQEWPLSPQTLDLSHFLWLRYIIVWVWIFTASTAPFTLIYDYIPAHWFNWIWVWILGLLNGMVVLIIDYHYWWLSFIPMIVYGALISLSNIEKTAKWLQWKFVEGAIYGSISYVIIQVLTIMS